MYMDKYKGNNNRGSKSKKGFTLIELIVVVLILGIVAGVAVPKITVMMGYGKTTNQFDDMKNYNAYFEQQSSTNVGQFFLALTRFN